MRSRLALLICLSVAGCNGTITAREHGRNLLDDTALSDSPSNVFVCSDCHEVEAGGAGDRILPGYTLVDSALRDSFWGGYERTLIDAMSFCRITFMRGVAFEEDEEDSRAILEYLLSISPTNPAPALPLTVTLDIVEIERGDAEAGADAYRRACAHCHGEPGGNPPSRFAEEAEPMPDDAAGWIALMAEGEFAPEEHSRVVIEKVRHGRFFKVGGIMPLFSREALVEEDLGALMAHMDTLGL